MWQVNKINDGWIKVEKLINVNRKYDKNQKVINQISVNY